MRLVAEGVDEDEVVEDEVVEEGVVWETREYRAAGVTPSSLAPVTTCVNANPIMNWLTY